jgi:hypothetical protein
MNSGEGSCGDSDSGGEALSRRGFVAGSPGLILVEPAFEECDGGEEVVAAGLQQVDGVEVGVAGVAVGEVVFRVDVGEHLAAARAEEDEPAFAEFGRQAVAVEVVAHRILGAFVAEFSL